MDDITRLNHSIQGEMEAAWDEYITKGTIVPVVPRMIANSWQRCRPRLSPNQKAHLQQLSAYHLLSAQVASFDLISIARPVMEDVIQYLEPSQIMVILVNSAGYIIETINNSEALKLMESIGIVPGGQLNESNIGNNAFSMALIERAPCQVTGFEHYLQDFHPYTDAAAPIFDLSGSPLGAVGIISFAGDCRHALCLSVLAARAIESQRQSDMLLAEQNSQLATLNKILGVISEGIMVWNANGVLIHVNGAAEKILQRAAETLVGRKVTETIHFPPFIQTALNKEESLTDVEAMLKLNNQTISCVLSIQYIHSNNIFQWVIVTLRMERDVRKLVQSQMGAYAFSTINDFVGDSPKIRRLRRLVKIAADARASVLIRGEEGTGKNLLASAIHNESTRQEDPFLFFPCSSYPPDLIVGELLGYDERIYQRERGGRPSRFELAQGGTLFFQDVDALPLEAQAILLNVIELGIVQRIGGSHPIEVDVRLIVASSANLEKLVAQGSFRNDLYYRLSAFEIIIPPLRETLEDLSLLIDAKLAKLSRQLNRPIHLEQGLVAILRKYSWPGNVQELEMVLERAAANAGESGVIDVSHLPEFIFYPINRSQQNQDVLTIQSLNKAEHELYLQTAKACGGNTTKMAMILGVSRTTVWRKVREFNISLNDFRRK